MSPVFVITTSEAEERWGLKPGTVRSACLRGKLMNAPGVRKSGSTWLVPEKVMYEEFGKEKLPK